jgi:HK97 family phage prohead protease
MNMKWATSDIKSQDARRISFIASHEKIDRDSELIVVAGIDTTEFERNPVLLLQHNQREVAVARVTSLRKTMIDGAPALVGEAVFPDRPGSDDALADVRAELRSAVSIGFRVLEIGPPTKPGQTGATYLKTNLIEISLVTLPSCQTCLVTSKSACRCDDALPPAPSNLDYSVDTLSRTLASHLAKSITPTTWQLLDDNEKEASDEMVNRLLGETVSAVVIESVRDEVRKQILYACGRVD